MAEKKENKLVTIKNKKDVTTPKKVKDDLNKKDAKPKKRRKKKSHKILNAILILIMLLGILATTAILVFCGYIIISAPDFDTDLLYSKEATIVYDKNGTEYGRLGREQRELVYYDDLPQVLIDAIIATEDSKFFQHNGFDIARFAKASLQQLAGQQNAGGASTLTMQVVKNTFTSTESHGWEGIVRKFTDIYMSVFKIEKNYTKEEIIEFYVNAPFLGSGTFGVEQACQTYFGKSVKDISLPEAALIAGIFNAPTAYNPFNSIDLATKRRDTVLNLMVRHRYITEEQANDAKSISVESLIHKKTNEGLNKYQSFIDTVIRDVEEKTKMNPYNTPMLIYTTLDPAVQDILNSFNREELGYKWVDDQIQIGLVITDVKDGSITAIDGDRNQDRVLSYNRATQMKTQPGSTIKPILDYGPYLEYNNGSPGTIFYDNPMTYSNGQKISNSDRKYKGAMTMRQALIESRNIPAVQAFQATDKNKIAEFSHACGIDYGDTLYEAYAIGGGMQVSPLEMAAAYGTFARGGYYIEPYTYTKIILQETDEVIEYKPEKIQAMSKETAYMITDMLVSATKAGVGGNNLKVSGTEIASKTGTSTYDSAALKANNVPDSASADNWVITYSPDYVISFWYGYDKLSHEYYTDSIKAAIQRKKISEVIGNRVYKKNSKFSKPDTVISSKYEKETIPTELPSQYTPANLIGTDVFKKGTEPSKVSTRFAQLNNPTNGKSSETNGTIKLSWTGIQTPNPINQSYLQNYFKENYGNQAETYLKRRIDYNNNNIGIVGYQVYLKTSTGEQSLGFTTDTEYQYLAPVNGNYTFVIRSAYSIFKSNMSTGLIINANSSSSIGGSIEDNNDDNQTTPEPTPDNNSGELEGAQ